MTHNQTVAALIKLLWPDYTDLNWGEISEVANHAANEIETRVRLLRKTKMHKAASKTPLIAATRMVLGIKP